MQFRFWHYDTAFSLENIRNIRISTSAKHIYAFMSVNLIVRPSKHSGKNVAITDGCCRDGHA